MNNKYNKLLPCCERWSYINYKEMSDVLINDRSLITIENNNMTF